MQRKKSQRRYEDLAEAIKSQMPTNQTQSREEVKIPIQIKNNANSVNNMK